MDITKILQQGQNLGPAIFGTEACGWIEAAAALARHLPDIAARIGHAGSPIDLVDRILATPEEPFVAAAFQAAGAGDLLYELRTLANAASDKIPAAVRVLLSPIGCFSESDNGTAAEGAWPEGDNKGRLAWSRNGDVATLGLGNGFGHIGVNGGATLDCEAGSLWFYPKDNVSSAGLLRIGFEGSLGVSAKGHIPFSPAVGVGIGCEAAFKPQAHIFWKRQQSEIYALALADAMANPVDIFSLAAVLPPASYADTGSGWSTFAGFVLAVTGHTSLDIDLGVMREFDVHNLLEGSAKLSVSVEVKRKANWELSGLRTSSGFRLVLSHDKERSRKWGMGLDIEVDVSGIAERLGVIVSDASENWDKILDDIKPFLSPGALLRTRSLMALTSMLDDLRNDIGTDGLQAEMVDALEGDLKLLWGVEADQKGLADVFADKLIAATSDIEKLLLSEVSSSLDKAIAVLSAKLPSLLAEPLSNALKGRLYSQVASLQSYFKDTLHQIAANRPKEVRHALAALGINVSDTADKVDQRLAGLRELVERADDIVHKVAAAVKDAAKAKISAKIGAESKRTVGEQYDLDVEFNKLTPTSSALYEAILHGRIQSAFALVAENQSPNQGYVVNPDRTSLRRYKSSERSLGYEALILGLNLTGSSRRSATADISYSTNGGVEVLVKTVAERSAKGIHQQRSTKLVGTYALSLAGFKDSIRSSSDDNEFVFSLSADMKQKDLQQSEVRKFLEGMKNAGLLSKARFDAIVAASSGTNSPIRGSAGRAGAVLVAMNFTNRDIRALVDLARGLEHDGWNDTGPAAETIVYTALGAMATTGEWSDKARIEWISENSRAKSVPATHPHPTPEEIFFFDRRPVLTPTPIPIGNKGFADSSQSGDGIARRKAVLGLLTFFSVMRGIWHAVPKSALVGNSAGWSENDYLRTSEQLGESANLWLGTNQWGLFFFGGKLDQRTLAFMLTLAQLARGPVGDVPSYDDMFSVTLQLADSEPQSY